MFRKRSARALAGGLAIGFLLVAASTAYAVVTGMFSGKTGQKQSISFHVGNGRLTNMRFGVLLRCPSGHIYLSHDKVLGAIKINTEHQFHKKLASTTSPTTDELEVSGRVFSKKVTGKLIEHLQIKKEKNAICVGRTSYTVHKQ
jgi:hypothetical protein